jgi:integrase
MATLRKRGKKWSIVESFRDPEGRVRKRFHATGVGCRRAAEALLRQFHENRDRGVAGILDPRRPLLDRPAADWLADYLTDLVGRDTSPHYVGEVGRVLRLMLAATGAGPVREFTPARVRDYLAAAKQSAATRNMHRAYAGGFFSFLTGDGRPYETCPFTRHSVPLLKAGQRRQARRAFTVGELRKLLAAADDYPLAARLANTGGRPKADGTPAVRRKPVRPSDATRAALALAGRERRLIYRTALLTGLRRGELSRLTVADVRLAAAPPRVVAIRTKNKRQAVIPLVPALASDLAGWVADTARGPGDRLFAVPCAGNLSRLHQAQMRHAGVPYRNADGVPATFHSLRRTVNVLLRKNGVPLPDRMRFLRHAARDLTSRNYDDAGRTTMTRRVYRLLAKLDAVIGSDTRRR